MNTDIKDKSAHSVSLTARRDLKITGVLQVISFDDLAVELSTSAGEVDIEGTALNIDALDLDRGYIAISGEVSGINYVSDKPMKKKHFWSRE